MAQAVVEWVALINIDYGLQAKIRYREDIALSIRARYCESNSIDFRHIPACPLIPATLPEFPRFPEMDIINLLP